MASSRLVLLRYAKALHALAHEAGAVDGVRAGLDELVERIGSDEQIGRQLASPRLTRDRKRGLLLALLGDGSHDLVRRTVLLLADKGRAGTVPELAGVFHDVAMEAAGRLVARVESAVPLDDEMRSRLVRELGALTGKTVTLDETVAEDLMGGLRIVMGSRMIDGSLKRRLERMGETLLGVPLAAAAD
jgi:F-type H+-transporting ATPase subunit delta